MITKIRKAIYNIFHPVYFNQYYYGRFYYVDTYIGFEKINYLSMRYGYIPDKETVKEFKREKYIEACAVRDRFFELKNA